ncbi:MAG: alpha-glucan family phosphorylase, partial [Spirochaetales bacterium]|nr:alpha-glucan family phosphorylase [Spirochaetales bacterium]
MNLVTLNIRPNIPEALKPLEDIAYNLWLSWNFEAVQLFIRIDYDTWVEARQNPVRMLGLITPEMYQKTAEDDSFIAAMKTVHRDLKRYQAYPRWNNLPSSPVIAYFSMEYGLDAGLPIYSGGLGMLAGDHLKAASDMGLPLVGVGLLYRQGYFKQYLNPDGYQQESYPENDFYHLPIKPCLQEDGSPVIIGVKIGESVVLTKIWKALVGRNYLYLLDTNLKENAPENRTITAALYGGDR